MSQEAVRALLEKALSDMGIADPKVHVERPRDPAHGDLATNVAMTLAPTLKRSPREVAKEIASRIPIGSSGVAAVEIAGPGFLNFRLSGHAAGQALVRALRDGDAFGRSDVGRGESLMVEFVSANPTGLLHVGHGRQAAIGDAIASLLEWTGWKVTREFYYNDAGNQIDRLGESLWARYQQHLGRDASMPEGGYMAETLVDLARELADLDGPRWLDAPLPDVLRRMREYGVARLRKEQDRDLTAFGVRFDSYYLESSLYSDGRVTRTIEDLRKTGLVFELEGALWLRTTDFGDQKDRVMVRSDGSPTYFLPDVAYHVTKWERGFRHVVNVQGADHHGTVSRVRAGLQALGLPAGYPEYVIHQMVVVEREGREVKFSKRAGDYVTLRDLIEEVGADVTRYFFLMRKPEAQLVFDLDQALDESDRNPVYKVKYAHARLSSILRKAGEDADVPPDSVPVERLEEDSEREIVQQVAEFPDFVARAAAQRAPHILADFLEKTAGLVNSWYHAGNPTRNPELAVLVADPDLRVARLVLTRAARLTLRNGLRILGIEAPERMERTAEDPAPGGSTGTNPDPATQGRA